MWVTGNSSNRCVMSNFDMEQSGVNTIVCFVMFVPPAIFMYES